MSWTPGWVLSQVSSVAARRSGSRSTRELFSKLTRMVPSVLPRRYAHSSTPSIFGVGATDVAVWCRILRIVIRELCRPRRALRAAAAFPPSAKPYSARASVPRVVRRAYTVVKSGSRSAKIEAQRTPRSYKRSGEPVPGVAGLFLHRANLPPNSCSGYGRDKKRGSTEWASGFGGFHRERHYQYVWCDFDLVQTQMSGETE